VPASTDNARPRSASSARTTVAVDPDNAQGGGVRDADSVTTNKEPRMSLNAPNPNPTGTDDGATPEFEYCDHTLFYEGDDLHLEHRVATTTAQIRALGYEPEVWATPGQPDHPCITFTIPATDQPFDYNRIPFTWGD
jgi:hypothetical protein